MSTWRVQGVRRMVALTGEDAQAARREAKQLQRRLEAAAKLQGEQLQAELASLKQVPPTGPLVQRLGHKAARYWHADQTWGLKPHF